MQKLGYLFPKIVEGEEAERQNLVNAIKKEYNDPRWAWHVMHTSLEKYAHPLQINFKELLLKKVKEAERRGKTLRVLEVGIGLGWQWLDFLKEHGHCVELHATSLTKKIVDPNILKKIQVKACAASALHRKFKPEYFDVIVSHFGTHFDERRGLESMLLVLKPGGEAIVAGIDAEANPLAYWEKSHEKHYKILKQILPFEPSKENNWERSKLWAYHIRKK